MVNFEVASSSNFLEIKKTVNVVMAAGADDDDSIKRFT